MTNPLAISQDSVNKMEDFLKLYQINENKLNQYHNLEGWTSIYKQIQSIKKKNYKQKVLSKRFGI